MPFEKKTKYGNINISLDAISTLAGGVVAESYGVVGMASQNVFKDGFAELLKMENYGKGVVVRKAETGYEIDLYVILSSGVKISEVVNEVQKKVKYELERSLDVNFTTVNIFVQGIRVTDQ